FVAPTPVDGSIVTSANIQVQLETSCTFDAASLVVHLNGSPLDASAVLPFGPCSGGRKQSQAATVAVTRPTSQITSGPKRLTAGRGASFPRTRRGDRAAGDFGGAGAPPAGPALQAPVAAAGAVQGGRPAPTPPPPR